jgi:hypothetical protein
MVRSSKEKRTGWVIHYRDLKQVQGPDGNFHILHNEIVGAGSELYGNWVGVQTQCGLVFVTQLRVMHGVNLGDEGVPIITAPSENKNNVCLECIENRDTGKTPELKDIVYPTDSFMEQRSKRIAGNLSRKPSF